MTRAQWVPVAQMFLSVIASVAYLMEGDYRRAVYWLAAAVLTASVTF